MAHRRRLMPWHFVFLLIIIYLVHYSVKRISSQPRTPVASSPQAYSQLHYIRPLDRLDVTDSFPVDKQISNEEVRKRIDQKYCGESTCRFMLPVIIAEQETKAQKHFRHLAFLAGSLDRTIVLPNVHSSHLGACRQHPFSFYYDAWWLDKNTSHFRYITMQNFRAWIEERRRVGLVPTGQEIFLEMEQKSPLSKTTNCFYDLFDFSHRHRIHFSLPDPENISLRKGNHTRLFLDALSDDNLQRRYMDRMQATAGDRERPPVSESSQSLPPLDVIHLFYDRRFGFIENPEAQVPLTYSHRWSTLADQIATQLQPYIAVHWRMERLEPVSALKPCAERLVEKIKTIRDESGMQPNVFLLTDYPHLLNTSQATPESMSFKLSELRQEHHDAIKYLYDHMSVTLTTLDRPNKPIPYSELPAANWNILPIPPYSKPADPQVLGILDKLVAMRAKWFLAGQPGVCGKTSSYTRQITVDRIKAYKAGDPSIRGAYDTFG